MKLLKKLHHSLIIFIALFFLSSVAKAESELNLKADSMSYSLKISKDSLIQQTNNQLPGLLCQSPVASKYLGNNCISNANNIVQNCTNEAQSKLQPNFTLAGSIQRGQSQNNAQNPVEELANYLSPIINCVKNKLKLNPNQSLHIGFYLGLNEGDQ